MPDVSGAFLTGINQYARWALEQRIAKGEVVGLLMTNRPEYLAIWLGITSVGGVVSLLNTNLSGPSLAHCINVVTPKHLIVAAEFAGQLAAAFPLLSVLPAVWLHGNEPSAWPRIDLEVEAHSGEMLSEHEKRTTTIEDRALYIYTSGTTGLPRPANISHARVMQWGHWFAGMMGAQTTGCITACRCITVWEGCRCQARFWWPGAHSSCGRNFPPASSGMTLSAGIVRCSNTSANFAATCCTPRLLRVRPPIASGWRAAMAWRRKYGTVSRIAFRFPQIFEFYASTEGGVSLFNVQGKRGAIGHIPGYLTHRFSPGLVVFDVEKGEPVRNAEGFCIRCGPNEAGEAIGKVAEDPSNIGSRFEGYTNSEASERKILRNVFEPGDAWIRTGDLMRKDEQGYFYFVDRIGDTFRWKGENVPTCEVSEAICAFPGGSTPMSMA